MKSLLYSQCLIVKEEECGAGSGKRWLLSGEGVSQVEDGVSAGEPEGLPLSPDSCSAYTLIFRLEMQQI